MQYIPDNPLVVQSDLTILVVVLSPRYAEARDALLPFAELIKSPEYLHTWRLTSLTLWNAAAAGHTAESVLAALRDLAKYPVPERVGPLIADRMARYGRLRLTRDGKWLRLEADSPEDLEEVRQLGQVSGLLGDPTSATLVREDGREGDVFALIGPRRFDLPWKTLEEQGWIAAATCVEIRVPLSTADRQRYVRASAREKFSIAAKNARKVAVVEALLARHAGRSALILGTWLDQLEWIARRLRLPLITGKTPAAERQALFERFRCGEITALVLSKVGNFAIDLPTAAVAIQIAGTWGSRQEEAQRLGRVLRAKSGENQAWFYTIVTEDSREQDLAERRQLFVTEQGYPYRIEAAS